MEATFFAIMVIALSASRILGTETEGCQSPQHLKIGGTGVVHCFFNPSFYGVLWFNSTEANLEDPFLKLVESEKSGEMGNYDIYPNGSLIIEKVSPVHDQTFTVVKFASDSEPSVSFSVVVITTVTPKIGFPVVAECGTEHRSCYTQLDASSEVNCFVRDARPVVSLTWFLRTAKQDRNISSSMTMLPRNDTATYTSHVVARNLFKNSTLLNLLVCKANDLTGMLSEHESYVFIENRDIALDTKPVKIFIKHDSQLTLSCSDLKADIIVWKKQEHFGDNFKILAYSFLFKNNYSKIFDDHYTLDEDGSLIVSHPHENDKGIYECSLQNGHTGKKNILVVNVIQTEGKQFLWVLLVIAILLGVVGIIFFKKNRRLQFKSKNVEAQNTPDAITPLMGHLPDERSQKQIDYTETDGGQGVLVDKISAQESSHSVSDGRTEKQIVNTDIDEEQTVPVNEAPLQDNSHSDEQLRKLIENKHSDGGQEGPVKEISFHESSHSDEGLEKQIENRDNDEGQTVPVNESTLQESSHPDLETFIEDLRSTYRNKHRFIRPVPSRPELQYSVESVFIDNNYEILTTTSGEGDAETWEKVAKYTEILERIGISQLTVIEGDPGCGKSTFISKLAQEWCNSSESSPLHNKDIFILLSMKDLLNEQSLNGAIRRSILPQDSRLTEEDIENFVQKCKSGVLILDDFDGYDDKEIYLPSDVVNILQGEKLENYIVMVVTRSFSSLKSLPSKTRRVRLTRFDDNLREEYIRKAIVPNNSDDQKVFQIKWHLQEVIGDLIQIPLIFVMFAHTFDERISFQSHTCTLKQILSCFYSHMESKVKQEDIDKLNSFKHEHHTLDVYAFDIATRKHGTTWKKDELCQKLGKAFYETYLQCGIFVETEGEVSKSGSVQYCRKGRFYHDIFCEWYAAHSLSKKLSDSELDLRDVENEMKTFKFRKVCLFASGINHSVREKIAKHFEQRSDHINFPFLCSLEMTQQIDAISADLQEALRDAPIKHDTDITLLWSIFQLLSAASRNSIAIPCLTVEGHFDRVRIPQSSTDTCLPVLNTLEQMVLRETKSLMTERELVNIFEYSSKCTKLSCLTFSGCEMPTLVQNDHLSTLRAKNVEVNWDAVKLKVCLNLQSGEWEYNQNPKRTYSAKQRRGTFKKNEYDNEIREIRSKRESDTGCKLKK